MKTRRQFLASAATSAAFTPLAVKAATRHFGEPRVLTTIKIVNHSRSEVPAGAVTQLIGCPFKKGDIAPGSWPQFQLTDGTPVPATILTSLATTWSDKSLKFVPVMLQIPVSIDAHVKVHIKVLSDGAFQQGSARSLADFTNGISPQVQVDGLDNLKGTWVMDLGQGIADGKKVIAYGNGPAGGVWKVRAPAMQGSKRHHHLVCDFYVAALSNMDGSLKGLRILGKVKLPYYDTKETMNWMSFSRFQLCADSNGTLIRDCFGKNFGAQRAYHFEWVSGSTFSANHGYSTDNGGDYGYCTRLSSTGQLPQGLSSSESYFIATLSASTVGFGTNSSVPVNHLATAADGGIGKHTATPYPYVAYFGALFTAGPAGTWDFLQGAGSDAADASLRCQVSKKYWVSTGLLPSYDITIKAGSNLPTSYWPNSSEPVTRYLGTTGERDDLGIMPAWYARHFLTQAAVDERAVRVISLVGGHFSIGLENSGTGTYPCVNNGADGNGKPYQKMPAPNSQFRWMPGVGGYGFPNGDTTNPNVLIAGFSQQDTSHMPQFNYYPYLLTGEPWHLDMLLEHANSAVYQRYTALGKANISDTSYDLDSGVRNLSVPGDSPTYSDTIGSDQERSDAWASALVAAAAGICPDIHPDCRSYKQYFRDMNATTWTAAHNIYKALPRYAKDNGLWHVPSSGAYAENWEIAYMGAAVSLAAAITEDKHAFVALEGMVKWFDHIVSNFGGWHVGSYLAIIKSGDSNGAPIVNSDKEVAFWGPNLNWVAGGHFALVPFSNYTPANGDKFIFTNDTPTPAGFAQHTPYYMINLNGNSFDLATRPSGVAMPLTDSYTGSSKFYFVSAQPPPTGSIAAIGSGSCYNAEVLGMLNYALAVGAKVWAGTIADLAYREQQAGTDLGKDPKWGMAKSFNQ